MFLWGVQNKEAAKTVNFKGKGGSLSLWRTLAKQNQIEEARQRHADRERGNINETHLTQAMGLSKEQKKVQEAPRDDVSEGSTACSSEDGATELEPLLWVSALRFEEHSTRQFAVTIGRSSTQQKFGLTCTAKNDGKIIIAEDAKQFGISKGDMILAISGCSGSLTVEKCMGILQSSLTVELSLLRIGHASHLNQGGKPLTWSIDRKSLWTTRGGVSCVDLLAVAPQRPLPTGPENQFTVRISRATCCVKFGLNLRSVSTGDPNGFSLMSKIYCAEDLPHLGLKKDDQFVSLNGRAVTNVTEFRYMLDTCMGVELLVERQSKAPSEEPVVWNPEDFAVTEDVYEDMLKNENVYLDILEENWTVPPNEDTPHFCVPKASNRNSISLI